MRKGNSSGLEDATTTSELEFSTLSIAVTSVRSGVTTMAQMMEESTQQLLSDLVEPVEIYNKHYTK